MKERCFNPKTKGYHRYGGRGITVCERWQQFENFLADMGERPPGLTLERVNNDGNYEPTNCKWVTMEEQQKNKKTRWKHASPKADRNIAAILQLSAEGKSTREVAVITGVSKAYVHRLIAKYANG